MRTNLLKSIFLIAIACLSSIATYAHDFEVDGIYYEITNSTNKEVCVTYKGSYSSQSYSGYVEIPETVTYSGTTFSVTSIGDEAFNECSGLTSITIPESITSIGEDAFYECTGLTSITIPNSVTSIGEYAFSDCSGLTRITIPESVTSIGLVAFSGCNGLTSIKVESGNSVYDSRDNCNAIIETATNTLITGCKRTIIPNSVTIIGDGAFFDCDGLTSITIPNSITRIGVGAFENCYGLTRVIIPNSVISIGDGAFIESVNLSNLTIGNSVTSIGAEAFADCNLTSITIPSSVTKIGNEAFSYNGELTNIVVESGNTVYDSRENCNAIIETATNTLIAGSKNTIIPNSITNIGVGAFAAINITSIEIPNSVTSIGDDAFCECDALTKVYSYAKVPPTCGEYVFDYNTKSNCILYVPKDTKSAYMNAVEWSDFVNIEEIELNRFTIADIEVRPGKSFTFLVELINEDAISGFQCDIYLPEGITAELYEDEYDIVLTDRKTSSHSISSALQPDGSIRVAVFSSKSKAFLGNDGAIFEIMLLASEDLQDGTQIAVKNIVLATPELTQFTPADITANVILKKYILGDANGDETVNITDAVGVVNTILGNEPASFVFDAADVVADGTINITDAIGVVNIILNGQPTPTALAQQPIKATLSATTASNKFYIEDFSIEAGESKEIAILLTNDVAFSGFQSDIYLPEGLSVYQEDDEYIFDLSSRATRSHSISSARQADGAYRIACFSSSSKDIKENEGELVYFTVIADDDFSGTHTITVKNTIFTQSDLTQYNLEETTATVTGSNIQAIEDIIADEDANAPVEYYNMQGIRVENPKNGIFIRRQGKKVEKVIFK